MNVREGGEYDECDDDKTIYFFALDGEGRIGVSMRARPTEDKCILADAFPHLIAPGQPPIKAAGVWEISRIFATRKFRTRRGLRRRTELFLATVQAACDHGVNRLVGMTDVFLLPQTLQAGWAVRILGLPAAYPEGEVIAVEVDSSRAGVLAFQDRLGQNSSSVFELRPETPLAQLPPEEAEAVFEVARGLAPDKLNLAAAIVSRVVQLQDTASDELILAMVERMSALSGGASAAH